MLTSCSVSVFNPNDWSVGAVFRNGAIGASEGDFEIAEAGKERSILSYSGGYIDPVIQVSLHVLHGNVSLVACFWTGTQEDKCFRAHFSVHRARRHFPSSVGKFWSAEKRCVRYSLSDFEHCRFRRLVWIIQCFFLIIDFIWEVHTRTIAKDHRAHAKRCENNCACVHFWFFFKQVRFI